MTQQKWHRNSAHEAGSLQKAGSQYHSAPGVQGTLNELLHPQRLILRRGLVSPAVASTSKETPAEAGRVDTTRGASAGTGPAGSVERVSAARAQAPPAQGVGQPRGLTSGLARGGLADRLRNGPSFLQRPRAMRQAISRRLRSRRRRGVASGVYLRQLG